MYNAIAVANGLGTVETAARCGERIVLYWGAQEVCKCPPRLARRPRVLDGESWVPNHLAETSIRVVQTEGAWLGRQSCR